MLSEEQRKRLIDEARKAGIPEADVLAAAERSSGSNVPETAEEGRGDETPAQAALVAERFLIGFLPYVTVFEFRSKVLGLSDRVSDDQLFTGEWLDLHGPKTATTAATVDVVTPTQMGEET